MDFTQDTQIKQLQIPAQGWESSLKWPHKNSTNCTVRSVMALQVPLIHCQLKDWNDFPSNTNQTNPATFVCSHLSLVSNQTTFRSYYNWLWDKRNSDCPSLLFSTLCWDAHLGAGRVLERFCYFHYNCFKSTFQWGNLIPRTHKPQLHMIPPQFLH